MFKPKYIVNLWIPLLILSAFMVVRFGLGVDGLYGQDSYEYLRYAQSLKSFITEGTNPGDYFWPVGYPLVVACISLVIPDLNFSAQLLSVVSFILVFIYGYRTLVLLMPKSELKAAIYVFVLFVLSPFAFRFALLSMADSFTLAAVTIGIFYVLRFTVCHKVSDFCIAAFMGSVAFMTRYASIVLIVPLLVYAWWILFSKTKNWHWMFVVVLIGTLPLLPHFLIRKSASGDFLQHDWLQFWSPVNFFSMNSKTRDGSQHYLVPNIIYAITGLFHPRYCLPGVFIVIFGFRKMITKPVHKLFLLSLFLYLIFLAGIPYQNNRFLLLGFPFLLVLLYEPAVHIISKWNMRLTQIAMILFTILNLGFGAWSFKKVYDRVVLERKIYKFVATENPKAIYTMDIDVSLNGRGFKGNLYNIWTTKYESIDTTAMIIFNQPVFSQQWKNMNPMKNWEKMNQYQLTETRDFGNGWKAYVFN